MSFPKSKIAATIILVFLFSQNANAAPVKAGASCTKLGQKTLESKQTYSCIKSGNKLLWKKVPTNSKIPIPTPTPSATFSQDPAILATDYSGVASKAKISITTSLPTGTSTPTIVFDAEPSVPQINISRMKEQATFALKTYSALLQDVKVIHFLLYENNSWALQRALLLNPTSDYVNYNFKMDMKNSFTGRPELHMPCRSFGGFSVSALKEPLVVVQNAQCDWADSRETTQGIDYSSSLVAHELTHLLQQRASGTENASCVLPAWLREGQAQASGIALSITDGIDTSANTRNAIFGRMIRPTGIDAFTSLETQSPGAEYNIGAALSEYLIGRSGLNKLILLTSMVNAKSHECSSRDAMMIKFASAFQTVYRQNLTSFYDEALPYVQYVFDNQPRI
ncbi:MAG: hypothetical protein H7227_00625 [Actinobacteria bacterium]|nr:hypothetical protein [Actinomycetota bacterium]